MSPEEKQQLKGLIVATSLYYGQDIPDVVLGLYVEDLADLPFAEVLQAIGELRRNPKTTRFPLPALIREQVAPGHSKESLAREITARVMGALSKFGYTNPLRARAYIGESGWEAIEMQGGWQKLCEIVTTNQITTHQAQLRDLTMGIVARLKPDEIWKALPAPEIPVAPSLEYHERKTDGDAYLKLMSQLGDMKQIEDNGGDAA